MLIVAVLGAKAEPAADRIAQGREVYEDFCETCHGRGGAGPTAGAFDLRKFPRDAAARFRAAVLDGKGTGMPAFRGRMTEEEIDLVWDYVRSGP